MKESFFMRVLLCKINCPFMCFCKPSAAHIYTSGPLKLENTPHLITSIPISDGSSSDKSSSEVKEEGVNGNQETECVLKSCVKKINSDVDAGKEVEKKRVKWIDNFGEELAEIKEFESSETGDIDSEEENSRCFCFIL